MEYEGFFCHILKIVLVLNPFSWIRIRIIFVWIRTRNEFFPEPDPYQSLSWIRIRNEFFHILDPDPYQNDTDSQQWNRSRSTVYHMSLYVKWGAFLSGWLIDWVIDLLNKKN